jgi:hypothetical protein
MGSREEFQEKNKILNAALSGDIVIPVGSPTRTHTKLYRIADGTIVTIFVSDFVFSPNPPAQPHAFVTKSDHPNLYIVLAKIYNSEERKFRRYLYCKMNSIQDLEKCFSSASGHTNHLFRGCVNLNDLESKHKFMLLYKRGYSDITRSFEIVPRVILAIACFVYGCNITFYDNLENITYFFSYNDRKTTTYIHENTEVFIKLPSTVIKLESNNVYKWKEHANTMNITTPMTVTTPRGLFQISPLGGRTTVSQTLTTVPNRKMSNGRKKPKSCYTALSKLLNEPDSGYLEHSEDTPDPFGLLPFLDELISAANDFYGFHSDTINQCKHLAMPLGAILAHLKNMDPEQWSHNILCPITCLKYNNLTLAVFVTTVNTKEEKETKKKKEKKTYFYAFNSLSGQVESRTYNDGFVTLTDQPNVLYLCYTNNQYGYYSPHTPGRIGGRNIQYWPYHQSITGKFSHLGESSFRQILAKLGEQYDLRNVTAPEEMTKKKFRPENPTTILVPTHIISSSGNSVRQTMQIGVKHHAMIIIFPCQDQEGEEEHWDTCIVHHPHQDQTVARAFLRDFNARAPLPGTYRTHCIKGRENEGCELGFYGLLYAYLGARCLTIHHFNDAMKKVHGEENLCSKVRIWTNQFVTGNHSITPAWLEQMTHI